MYDKNGDNFADCENDVKICHKITHYYYYLLLLFPVPRVIRLAKAWKGVLEAGRCGMGSGCWSVNTAHPKQLIPNTGVCVCLHSLHVRLSSPYSKQ